MQEGGGEGEGEGEGDCKGKGEGSGEGSGEGLGEGLGDGEAAPSGPLLYCPTESDLNIDYGVTDKNFIDNVKMYVRLVGKFEDYIDW